MLKKCVYFVRGSMKTLLPVILLIAMVSYYFWHVQITSFVAGRIEISKQNGIIFYTSGIWSKMNIVKNNQDQRTQRALELLGKTRTVNEKSGLYSVAVPESWNIISEEGPSGSRVSKIVLGSPAFSQRQEGADIFYDNGAQLTIQAIRGQQAVAASADGGHGKNLVSKTFVTVESVNIYYYIFKNDAVKTGELADTYVLNGGYTYHISYVFNPQKFDGGEFTFQEILGSLKFGNKK